MTTSDLRCELRLGRWQDALADVGEVDALITDPPYSERTHKGASAHNGVYDGRAADSVARSGLGYDAFTEADVTAMVDAWAPRVRGWMCFLTSHDLVPAYEAALRAHDRYVFVPLPCIQRGLNVRLGGDGPSNWTAWLVVARPRAHRRWGTLCGAYVGTPNDPQLGRKDRISGGKPLWLMRALVRDYSRPGDLICDPCAGAATTLIAARAEGRHSVGAEMDPATHALAAKRIGRPYTPMLFEGLR
jgi:site-specific DNA-methyltransferase (adenine-specific)